MPRRAPFLLLKGFSPFPPGPPTDIYRGGGEAAPTSLSLVRQSHNVKLVQVQAATVQAQGLALGPLAAVAAGNSFSMQGGRLLASQLCRLIRAERDTPARDRGPRKVGAQAFRSALALSLVTVAGSTGVAARAGANASTRAQMQAVHRLGPFLQAAAAGLKSRREATEAEMGQAACCPCASDRVSTTARARSSERAIFVEVCIGGTGGEAAAVRACSKPRAVRKQQASVRASRAGSQPRRGQRRREGTPGTTHHKRRDLEQRMGCQISCNAPF